MYGALTNSEKREQNKKHQKILSKELENSYSEDKSYTLKYKYHKLLQKYLSQKHRSINDEINKENSEKENFFFNVGMNFKNANKNKISKKVEIKKFKSKNNNDVDLLESENDYILIRNEKPQIKTNIFKANNIKNINNNIQNENKSFVKTLQKEKKFIIIILMKIRRKLKI